MGKFIKKKVQGLMLGVIKNYVKEKCNIEINVPSVKVNKIISGSEDFTKIAENLGHMLREEGTPEYIVQELIGKFPELVNSLQLVTAYIDDNFNRLNESIIQIQIQMHTDKLKDVESAMISIDKRYDEENVTQDEWKRLAEDLEKSLNRLEGEIENNINICNKAPIEFNTKGVLDTLKFFLSKGVNTKQVEESLQIIKEDLSSYEEGIRKLCEVEMYNLNRINSAKKTLNKAAGFISENFLDICDKNGKNRMELLTDEKIWTENPKAFCDTLNGIIPELEKSYIT